MAFKPLHDRVLVRRTEGDEKTAGGLIIPDSAKEKPAEGEVVSCGDGARKDSGELIDMAVSAGDKVLFGHVSHVVALVIFSEQVIKRLVLFGTAVLWDRVVPSICVREHRIHVKNNPAKRMLAVADDLAQMIFCARFEHILLSPACLVNPQRGQCLSSAA